MTRFALTLLMLGVFCPMTFAQEKGVSLKKLAERLGKSRNYVRERLKHFGLSAPSEDE